MTEHCALQLSKILKMISNQSLQQQIVKCGNMPQLLLLQKYKNPEVLSDFRPAALTSSVMKALRG